MYYPSLAYAGFPEEAWAWARKNAPVLTIVGIGTFVVNHYIISKTGVGRTYLDPLLSLVAFIMIGIGGYFIVTNATATSKYAGEEAEEYE